MNIPNWQAIDKTFYKNYFQYSGVPLTELINRNALPFPRTLSIDYLKFFLTVNSVSVSGIILCVAKFVDEL